MNETLRVRATWFEKPRALRLVEDAIVVTTPPKTGGPAPLSEAIAFRDVVEVRISHSPSRFATNRFRCRLKVRTGASLTFHNAIWEGPVSEKDLSADYRVFVVELCRRVAAANSMARFLRGRPRSAMLVENGLLLALFVAMIAVFALFKTRIHSFQIIQITLIVVYFPAGIPVVPQEPARGV